MKNYYKEFDLWWHRPNLSDFYFMFTQMYLLLNSGSPMQEALSNIASVIPNEALSLTLKRIVQRLRSGMSPAKAFGAEKIFPQVVAPTIEAGDKAGQLSNTCFRLADLMWLQHNLYSKVGNALFVPKLASIMMALVVIGYVKFAIPEYIKMYTENGMEIPGIIASISGFVNGVVDNWYFTIVCVYVIIRLWKKFCEKQKVFIDRIRLNLPVYKALHFNFLQHQFLSTVELMLSSGLNMPEAMTQAEKVVDSAVMAKAISDIRKDMLKGNNIAVAVRKNNSSGVFDQVLLLVLDSGERSNRMSEVLSSAKSYYERILANSIDPISTKITFLVMIPMGFMIVGLYAFTMVPMLSYMSNLSGGG